MITQNLVQAGVSVLGKHWKPFRDRRMRRHFSRELEEINLRYSDKLRTATGIDREALEHYRRCETEECVCGLWSFETVELLRRADHYSLDCSNPDWYTDWEGDRILTERGQNELRRLIKIARRANIEWWIKSIAAIIGVLLALIAMLRR